MSVQSRTSNEYSSSIRDSSGSREAAISIRESNWVNSIQPSELSGYKMNGSIDLDEKASLKPADLVHISDHLSEGPIGVASSEL